MRNVNWAVNQAELRKVISDMGINSLLVHSDSFKALRYIDFDQDVALNMQKHVDFLFSLCSSVHLPSFNYDFPRTRIFNYDSFDVQVGAIPTFYLETNDCNRTFDPMFSVIQGKGDTCFTSFRSQVTSFEQDGYFAKYRNEGSGFLLYGSTIASLTFIHYLEACMEVAYRYDKSFLGHTVIGQEKLEFEFKSHFRPLGNHLDYDWKKIENDLVEAEVMVSLNKYCHIINAHKMFFFWQDKLKNDGLYFLDDQSLGWVVPKLNELGRRFLISDFE